MSRCDINDRRTPTIEPRIDDYVSRDETESIIAVQGNTLFYLSFFFSVMNTVISRK